MACTVWAEVRRAVPAGVGDDQRRLGGEHHQGLLVFGGELQLLLADVEGPDALPKVTDGRGHEGQNGAGRHRRAELGKPQMCFVKRAARVPRERNHAQWPEAALTVGRNTSKYTLRRGNKIRYVGITNNPEAESRRAQASRQIRQDADRRETSQPE